MCKVTKLNKYDVLCGRGSGPNERVGNINFRDLVGARKAEYLAIDPRDHRNKNRIAKEIIETVRSCGGRFLKKAAVTALEGEPEVYELADEKTVMEKAKQALRQNNKQGNKTEMQSHQGAGNVSPEGQPSMMHERAAQPFFSSDPYQAFLLHMQQASMQQQQHYGMNLSGAPTQDALMQSYMTAQQPHVLSGQNPYFGTAPGMPAGMVDPRDVLRPQQQQRQQHAMPNIAMSGPQTDNLASLGTALGDVARSDYIRHQLGVVGGRHDADPAASTLHAREEYYDDNTVADASPSSVRLSLSEDQMTALEKLFISSSQRKATTGASTSQHERSDSRSFNQESFKRRTSEPFIDGLDDMSLPSMSIGEISDLSWQERVSIARSRMSSVGGPIIEGTERESADESSGSGSFNPPMKPQEIAVRGPGTSCLASVSRDYDANRHVSFLGSEHSSNPVQMLEQMLLTGETNPPRQPTKQEKKKSLSSYYREMKDSSTVHSDEVMSMSQDMLSQDMSQDVLSQFSWRSWSSK